MSNVRMPKTDNNIASPGAKLLTNTGSSGIINTKVINNSVINPMNLDRYLRMKQGLLKNGIITLSAQDDDLKYLVSLGAEASYGNGYILHMGEIPSASAMFEEIIHSTQAKKFGEFQSTDYAELYAREIAANRMLLRNQKAYGFDLVDIEDIETNLQRWEEKFKTKVGCSYDESSYHREI